MTELEASQEVERKYTAPHGFVPPPVPSLGAWTPLRRFDLRAEYHDTPGLALARRGFTLRRRTGGEDAGWHLKSPAAGGARTEERLGLDEGRGGVPDAFRARLGGLVVGVPLIPVAVIATVRNQADLLAGDGRTRAHLCSDAVTSEVRGVSARWDEVECELAPDEPVATLDTIESALLAAGCGQAAHSSKLLRAIGALAPASPPTLAGAGGDLVLAYAAKQVGALQSHAAGVLVDAPDAVHKSRVAARRLRSVLRRFASLLDAEYAGRLVGELRWYGEVAGAPRDAEVLKEHLLSALADLGPEAVAGPVGTRLVAQLDGAHAAAHRRLVEEMDADRYAALQRRLPELLSVRPVRDLGELPAEFIVRDLVEAAVGRVRRRYRRAAGAPEDMVAWHEVRKAAKAVRYACEALETVCGKGAAASEARWEGVTEALGDAQDTVVAHDILAELADAASAAAEPTRTFRALQKRQLAKRSLALASGRAALDAALADPLDWLP